MNGKDYEDMSIEELKAVRKRLAQIDPEEERVVNKLLVQQLKSRWSSGEEPEPPAQAPEMKTVSFTGKSHL